MAGRILTEPRWEVVLNVRQGRKVVQSPVFVRAKTDPETRQRAKEALNADLAGSGHVVGVAWVTRIK
jgi:hypothetical protein